MSKTAYPLAWPPGWPKTQVVQENTKFKQTLSGVLALLKDEIARLGGKNLILSSNYTLGNERPKLPGVVAYFDLNGKPIAIPCDRWSKIEHNVYAIALTVEAIRGMDRWGAKHMIEAMFQGFKALPEKAGGAQWFEVIPCDPKGTFEAFYASYREAMKKAHPDAGGNHEAAVAVNEAYAEGLKHFGK